MVTDMAHLFAVIMLVSCVVAGLADQRTDAVLRVSLKPLYGSRKFLYVRKQQDVTLKCDPIDIDSVGYYWTHNGVTSDDVTSDQLYIRNVSAQNEGPYNCLVDKGQGSLLSETIIVKLAEITKVLGGRFRADENDNAIPCDVTGYSVPRGHVTWTRSGQDINVSDNKHIDLNGTLIFLYKKSDDKGDYQCHVKNRFLNDTISGNKTYLQDSDRQQSGPRRVSSSRALSATEGDDIILECVFEGDPSPNITWTSLHGNPLRENRKYNFSSYHRRLKIAELAMSDSGQYICIANNSMGTEREIISLSVIGRPRAVDPPKSITVLNGTNVTSSCATNPAHKVTWFINGMPLKADDNFLLRMDGTELTIIPSAHKKDDLCVQCNITDDNSYTVYSACIHYVDTEEELPTTTTTTTTTTTAVTNGSNAETQTSPSELTTIVIHVAIGVTIAIVVIIVTVIIIVIARKRCKRKKTRLSTVGSEIPKRSSLFWETQFFLIKRKDRFPSKTCQDEEGL